jgi:predicted O-methyltransferase YrrM
MFLNENKPPEIGDHYLLGLRHRIAVLSRLPERGNMLEYGSGDSTLWFRANLKEGQSLMSIENDSGWAQRTGAISVGGRAGDNGMISEEALTTGTAEYVWQPLLRPNSPGKFDVILIDGVWRTMCLLAAIHMLAPGGVVFLHDAQRDWYETGKVIYKHQTSLDMCDDYAGTELVELRP